MGGDGFAQTAPLPRVENGGETLFGNAERFDRDCDHCRRRRHRPAWYRHNPAARSVAASEERKVGNGKSNME
jgi:hypothetical protein